MPCIVIKRDSSQRKENEKARDPEGASNAEEKDTEPKTAGAAPLKVREQVNQVKGPVKVKGKVRERQKGIKEVRAPRADALIVAAHTTHPHAQKVKGERQMNFKNLSLIHI